MTTSEVEDGRSFEKQVQTPDNAYPHVIEKNDGFVPPSEGSWAHIGQSGNVLYGIRQDGKITDVGAITTAHIGRKYPDLAQRIADDSMDMVYKVDGENIRLRTFVEQKEILKAISDIALNESKRVG